MDLNKTLRDAKFKDNSPLDTVEKIKGILSSYNIETVEEWYQTSVPYCFALRLTVEGTTFGVNGKGLTREFALASAYGEMMERLQLGYIGSRYAQKESDGTDGDLQGAYVPASELLCKNRRWYDMFAQQLYKYSGVSYTAEQLFEKFTDDDGNVQTDTYFNITSGCADKFPTALRRRVYSSNGCAAGNTMAEAIVQALGEIVERNHRLRIIEEKLALPDIPEEILAKYTVSYDIIKFVRNSGYRVIVKDASLGTKYPVVCVCFISEKTGRYHTHFGAYPIFEIALSRALTESFQGRNIDNIAQFENFAKREEVCSAANIVNELVKGTGEKLADFFVAEPAFEFNENVGFKGENNEALLLECIEFFKSMGYDILVRNCACLGFPTYQVIVPGYSEVYIYRLEQKLDDNRYSSLAMNAARYPSKAGVDDLYGLIMHINQKKKVNTPHGFLAIAKLAAQPDSDTESCLMSATLAYVCYALGKLDDVRRNIKTMLNAGCQDAGYLMCLKRYLSLKENKYTDADIKKVLQFFHSEDTVCRLYDVLERGENPLEKFTLHCDFKSCSGCQLEKACCHARVAQLTGLIAEKTSELDFDAFSREMMGII